MIELATGNGAERPPAGKRQNSSALRFGRAIHFSYPHLKQVTARHRPSKIVLVDKIKASEDWRAQAFLLERRWPNAYDFERVTFWARRQIWHSLRLIDLGLRARCIAKFRARS
ncbi:MAG: hypothetical protein DME29_00100 [Verrucomicrobia bacterium]|nr:MAG: hypothetical protein DME29_00100 [Verrucomicrobiota bacterium]